MSESCPKSQGEKTEARLLSEFVCHDLAVLTPFGENHRYDCVIEKNDKYLRIQCKTGRYKDGKVIFSTKSTRPRRTGNSYDDYTDSIDYFAVYCWELESAYLIPIDDAASSEMVLRVEPPSNNQSKGINWADEYKLSDVLNTTLGT
ncbi:group I intron-associated PD-(D/E)XK endonuclease [Natronobacterium texcoconense]|uniref:PD-(D/E)XK endonuclease n=1 Tax=Natronobacterium texcoconense TaxID=1095778 RepID=A0A1H1HVB1_NATTX|nr:group I intron-associated PD-(D/E)XK endonuclease [Natronobacterium texcoconense]SDR29397.1 PD-(D/E)XK endonuclease [Natronobacterium texcoconense]